MLKKLSLLIFLTSLSIFAMDQRLNKYPDAREDYIKATQEKDQSAAFQLALFYEMDLKDNEQAIKWYEQSYKYGSERAAYNLGLLYEKKEHNYKNAIHWYTKAYNNNDEKSALALGILYRKKMTDYKTAKAWYKLAYEQGNMGAANGLGNMYEHDLKNIERGLEWYKRAAKKGDRDSINNLGRVYHSNGNNTLSSAYMLVLINYGYTKKEVLSFLKNDWKIDRQTLEKAYKLQQTLDIPNHYTGGID